MKLSGYVLIAVAFLGGSLSAVWHASEVLWGYYITMIVMGFLGVLLVRLGHKKLALGKSRLASNMDDITNSLTRIVANITQLDTDKQSIDTYDMRHRIDELIAADIITFVDARESITTLFGLAAYADIMSHFAAGERYLNRVWSASVDGYIDEVNAYLEKSGCQFTQALDLIKKQNQNT